MALGLFSQDPHYRYGKLLREIRQLGATHVSLCWVWWQTGVADADIEARPGRSATKEQVRASIIEARQLGLHVTLFPIVRLLDQSGGAWRGRIQPEQPDLWWARYERYILLAADIAATAGAHRLSVGSELLQLEGERRRWHELIDHVRIAAPRLELMYSANWDHAAPVSFWDLVDVIGMTAYWELTRDFDASVADLKRAWVPAQRALFAWLDRVGRPVVFTEVGYPSTDGGAAWPWDHTRAAPVDLEEQRRAYQAFIEVWSGDPRLRGVYFWNWFGFSGRTPGYAPRGKPAADEIRRWYRP